MNESQIAAQLAASVAEPIPAPTVTPTEPVDPPNYVDKMLPEEHYTAQRLLDFLQVGTEVRHNPEVDNYIQTIYQWARDQAGTDDYYQILRVIQEQEMHMGSHLKPQRLQRLAEYVKISKLRQQLAVREREIYG
jgi:hypothetical protein